MFERRQLKMNFALNRNQVHLQPLFKWPLGNYQNHLIIHLPTHRQQELVTSARWAKTKHTATFLAHGFNLAPVHLFKTFKL